MIEIVERLLERADPLDPPLHDLMVDAAQTVERLQGRIDDALRLEHKPGAHKGHLIAALKHQPVDVGTETLDGVPTPE